MRQPGRLILMALFSLACILTLSGPLLGQSESSGDESSPLPPGTVTEEPGALEPGGTLPGDLPTRETFEIADSEPTQIGPTAVEYIRVLGGLAIVIAVVYVLSLLLRRFVSARGLTGSTESLKILYTLNLSPTRTLYLVRLQDRIILIGAGEGGLRTLAEIDDPVEVSSVLQDLEFKGNFDLNPFRERLSSLIGEGDSGSELEEDLDKRQRKLKQALDRLKRSGDDEA